MNRNYQPIEYTSKHALEQALITLKSFPPLVSLLSIKRLEIQLSTKPFVLILGDCAEPFSEADARCTQIKQEFGLRMKNILQSKFENVCLIMRMAGQYAKPRSSLLDANQLAYRGDMINSFEDREYDPKRLIQAYESASNILKTLTQFTAHEALHLDYENTQLFGPPDQRYCHSSHMLWVGNRTRQLDSVHLDFASKIRNPTAIKIGPCCKSEDFLKLLKKFADRRILLISRFGKEIAKLEPLLRISREKNVMWVCDPMHGNTLVQNGQKLRFVDDLIEEIEATCELHRRSGTLLSGIHLECSPFCYLECLDNIKDSRSIKSTSLCDPRLNEMQTAQILTHFSESFY